MVSPRSLLRPLKKTHLFWRYVSNLSSTFHHRIGSKVNVSPIEENVLQRLNADGIAFTSVEDLFGNDPDFAALEQAVNGLIERRKDEIASLKDRAAESEIGSKTFNLEVLGSEVAFDQNSIFARVALNKRLLNIADSYFQLCTQLRYYNVWKTFASSGSARESQLWHFDREDNYILKVFLYLDDVDEGAGPFTYAPGTHAKGRYRKIRPEHFLEGGVRRTTDDQMRAVYPEDRWIKAIGKKGTIIFADTRGFHKGGEARTKDRLMYTCMYTSPASQSKNLINIDENFTFSKLDARQRRALRIA
jgi:phytanoyl-CoA dioxygenase PhyH